MKTISGSILILAAAIIIAPEQGSSVDIHNAAIIAFVPGIAGVAILAWGLFGKNAKSE